MSYTYCKYISTGCATNCGFHPQLHNSQFSIRKGLRTCKISPMPPRCRGKRTDMQNWMLTERHTHSGVHVANVLCVNLYFCAFGSGMRLYTLLLASLRYSLCHCVNTAMCKCVACIWLFFVCVLFVSCMRLRAMLLDMLSGGLLIMISVILWILLWESNPADGVVMVFTCACGSGDGGLLADIYKERSLNSNT